MLKLLVVEDHALVREGLVRLLAQMERGVEVKEAADFETALNVLENDGEFDLVLLDLALPGIDGFAGLDILRRRFPAMPVAVARSITLRVVWAVLANPSRMAPPAMLVSVMANSDSTSENPLRSKQRRERR